MTDKFDKIIGYDSFKKDLRCLADMLSNTARYKKFCTDLPKSLLIYGNPGVGKTLAATILLEESKRNSYIIRKDRSDNELLNYISDTFKDAANNQPSIILLDDLDKFAEGDEDTYNDSAFVLVQSLLDAYNEDDIFVVATVNDITELPDSLLRAGRLGRHMHFDLPSNADALAIINHYLKSTKYKLDVSTDIIARIMQGYSCADLKNVISEASLSAGYAKRKNINKDDIKDALLHGVLGVRDTYGKTDDESNLRTIYHEAGHAIVALALGNEVDMISSVVSGDIGGFTLKGDGWQEENLVCNYNYRDYVLNCLVDFGGKAATELIFGDIDLGTYSDLNYARKNIDAAIGNLGVKGFKHIRAHGKVVSIESDVHLEVVKQMKQFYKHAKNIIKHNLNLLFAIRDELLKCPILLYDDIIEIVNNIGIHTFDYDKHYSKRGINVNRYRNSAKN